MRVWNFWTPVKALLTAAKADAFEIKFWNYESKLKQDFTSDQVMQSWYAHWRGLMVGDWFLGLVHMRTEYLPHVEEMKKV
jgi:hypothetical protein